MLNKSAILFLVFSACVIAGSVFYQQRLSSMVLYLERALLQEDKDFYNLVQRYSIAVEDKIKMRESYTDSFQFIFPLFEAYDTNYPCSNRPSVIDALVDKIASNSALHQIKNQEYASTLDVFMETHKLILAVIDSMQIAQKPKEVPVLVVEKYSKHKDSCSVTMTPLFSMQFPDSVRVYKYDQLLHYGALPFTYKGSVDGFRLITKDGQNYGKH